MSNQLNHKTMFFQKITQMMQPSVDLNITISKLGKELMVAVMPKFRELKD